MSKKIEKIAKGSYYETKGKALVIVTNGRLKDEGELSQSLPPSRDRRLPQEGVRVAVHPLVKLYLNRSVLCFSREAHLTYTEVVDVIE